MSDRLTLMAGAFIGVPVTTGGEGVVLRIR